MERILVVDDDSVNLLIARACLKDYYDVRTASNGRLALKFLQKNDCDLILLHIVMPDINGIEVFKEIREDQRLKDIPVVFLTSENDKETEGLCLESGAADFISKPFVPEILRLRVERIIDSESIKKNLQTRLKQKEDELENIKAKEK